MIQTQRRNTLRMHAFDPAGCRGGSGRGTPFGWLAKPNQMMNAAHKWSASTKGTDEVLPSSECDVRAEGASPPAATLPKHSSKHIVVHGLLG
jgi:hypothetical protein